MSNTNAAEFWEEFYRRGTISWDLGGPTPVFRRLLDAGKFPPGRLLVPGAGSGHDAREFARRGFAVTAVDFASEAVRMMRALAEPDAPGRGRAGGYLHSAAHARRGFDYVLEYMCFCAIDPQRRTEYADALARLLKPGGVLIDLAFPVGTWPGGPPYAVSPDGIVYMFERRGFALQSRERPPDSAPQRRCAEELLIFQKL